jgi:hypothetical protein
VKHAIPISGRSVRVFHTSYRDRVQGQDKDIEKLADSGDAGSNGPDGGKYVFRGDDNYRGGPVGRTLGDEADAANIQDAADHVLRKESHRSSRYTSFTTELKVARRFTSAVDNRHVSKVELARLRELETEGRLAIWDPERTYEALRQGARKLARQAADVRASMRRNSEILIEGQIPPEFLGPVNS